MKKVNKCRDFFGEEHITICGVHVSVISLSCCVGPNVQSVNKVTEDLD